MLYQLLEVGKAWEQGYLKIGIKVTMIRTIKELLLCNHNFENDLCTSWFNLLQRILPGC